MFTIRHCASGLIRYTGVIRRLNVQSRRLCSTQHKQQTGDNHQTKDQFNEDDEERREKEQVQKAVMLRGSFEHVDNKNKSTYLNMVEIFVNRDVHRRNHVEFIYAALRNMEAFGVHRDLDVYKSLIDVMPKGKYIPTNIFQVEFMHYPKQQQCMIDLLEQMEDHGVIPDYEMEDMLVNIFGRKGHPVRKFWRMMYWMPKFKNLSPWLLPNPVPNDTLELAKLAVNQMCTVDLLSEVKVYETNTLENAIDDTWIVSGISKDQRALLEKHDTTQPLHIEGPFLIWLRNKSVNYFTLRGDPPTSAGTHIDDDYDPDDVSNIQFNPFGFTKPMANKVAIKKTVHEQTDGTIFAICATGTSSKDSLLSWIRLLEQDGNPGLTNIPVLFKFRSLPQADLPAVIS